MNGELALATGGTVRRHRDAVGPDGGHRYVVRGAITGDGLGFVMSALVAGGGIGLVPLSRAKEVESEELLVRVLPEYSTKGADFSVVVTSRQLPQRVVLVRDFLVQALLREELNMCPKSKVDEVAQHNPQKKKAARLKLEAAAE